MKDVVYIGPDYHGHRGGIGAVLETYSANIAPFKFIPSYSNRTAWPIVFLKSVIRLTVLLIKDRDIKIVHIHAAQKGSFMRKSILMLVSKLFGKRVVMHMHASLFREYYQDAGIMRPYIRFILGKADAVVCLSKKWFEFYASNFKIKHLLILKNVVERPAQEPSYQKHKPVRLLFLGLIGERKGLFDLLKVLEVNKKAFEDAIELTIGGNGDTDRLITTIAKNHQEGNVQFKGWVVGEQKDQLLRSCDVYILPSYNEGLPISILEAMANGKPIISTTIGGIPEIVLPGKNGWLFEPGDLQALTSILNTIVGNPDVLEEYGAYSYRLAKNYTPEEVMGSMRNLYDRLLSA